MAKKSDDAGSNVAADPDTIRADMARTRANLGRELDALKGQLLGTPQPAGKKGKKTVAAHKSKSAEAASKKPSAKKSTGSVGKKVVKKTKEVLGDLLAGAAVGAVKGAAEAAEPLVEKAAGSKKKK